jgi:hypothetical protein
VVGFFARTPRCNSTLLPDFLPPLRTDVDILISRRNQQVFVRKLDGRVYRVQLESGSSRGIGMVKEITQSARSNCEGNEWRNIDDSRDDRSNVVGTGQQVEFAEALWDGSSWEMIDKEDLDGMLES